MLLRISRDCLGESTVVRVEGNLGGSGVEELARTCREASGNLVIDLASLLGADEVGLALLRSLRAAGATLREPSPYVRLLLEGFDSFHGEKG